MPTKNFETADSTSKSNRAPNHQASSDPSALDFDAPASSSKRSPVKQAITTALKIAFAAGLISWMIQKGALDLNAFKSIATPGLVGLCAIFIFVGLFANNYRWLILLRGQGVASSIRYTLPLSFIGLFFNFFMPGGVGGDVVKGFYLLQDYPKQRGAGAISIFLDRLIGFFVMVGTAFIALFLNWDSVSHSRELQSIAVSVTALFLAFIGFFTLALSRRIGRRFFESKPGRWIVEKLPGGATIQKIYVLVHEYRKQPEILVKAILISVFTQIPNVGLVYAVGLAMGVHEIPLQVYFFLVPVGTVILALPISPAGIGVGQAAFYFLFSLYLGKSSQLGPTAVTLMQVMNFCWGFVGAYFYLHRKKPASLAAQ